MPQVIAQTGSPQRLPHSTKAPTTLKQLAFYAFAPFAFYAQGRSCAGESVGSRVTASRYTRLPQRLQWPLEGMTKTRCTKLQNPQNST